MLGRKTDEKIAAEIAENRAQNAKHPANRLPLDIIQLFYQKPYINRADGLQLFRAAPRLFKRFHDEVMKDLRKLLSHTVLGEWEQAEAIWRKDPSLLTLRGTIYHPNRTYFGDNEPVTIPEEQSLGRYKHVNQTAYQIALRHGAFNEAELMGKNMPDEEKEKQILEIFPNGEMSAPQNLEEAKKLLGTLFEAILKDDMIDDDNLTMMNGVTQAALQKLREHIKPNPKHQTGLVFDLNIYLAALQKLASNYNNVAQWRYRTFWCIRVEEMIASVLGVGDLCQHAQGIGNAAGYHRKGCLLPDKSSYFAFRRAGSSLAGFHFFVGVTGVCYIKTGLGGSGPLAQRSAKGSSRGSERMTQFQNYGQANRTKGKAYVEAILTPNSSPNAAL